MVESKVPDRRSAEAKQYRRLYKTAAWRKLRHYQLSIEPLCRFCIETEEVTAAEVVDHIKSHHGDIALFLDLTNIQSLCKPHHDGTKQRMERGAIDTRIDANGWPEWRKGK
ncbi:HNH endonuclease [Rhizobium sp. CC1099]|uniref:HNH endonuclease n=1 Tax=Rhizobium sp. CC1099 TaxID=3039160 RepID=UPI0024B24FB0|nr:HNH endonuclease [Rhizobium sp. CC1099]WFU88976.1 HNH endonuclease [Rhizobium sp. CC1099]